MYRLQSQLPAEVDVDSVQVMTPWLIARLVLLLQNYDHCIMIYTALYSSIRSVLVASQAKFDKTTHVLTIHMDLL